jgi:hydrogenase maturation protease
MARCWTRWCGRRGLELCWPPASLRLAGPAKAPVPTRALTRTAVLSVPRDWGPLAHDKIHTMARVLIIAYGNPLRCDDGLAWRAANQLEEKLSTSEIEILRVHQLTPELAEAVCRCDAVIFVDAAAADGGNGQPGEVRSGEIDLTREPPRFSHQLSPGAVVTLARQLYGAAPRAFSATLMGQCFDHGESLSDVVAGAIPLLVARIVELVRFGQSRESLPPLSNKA